MDLIVMNLEGSGIVGECMVKVGTVDYSTVPWIELLSYSHGISLPMQFNPSTNGRTVGRSQHGDFTVTKQVDMSTAKLNLFCCSGKSIAKLHVHIMRNDGGAAAVGALLPIIQYTMENAIVSSVSVSGGSGGAPMETVTFNYTKITWHYESQKESPEGTETKDETIWDLNLNAAGAAA